jgi:hypothetical protein
VKSENPKERQVAIRINARVVKGTALLFSKQAGGDLVIEAGDKVTIVVEQKQKQKRGQQ